MKVYLLSGWSGSGKDTLGRILIERYNFQRFAFADVLKEMVAAEFGFPVEWAHTETGKQTVISDAGKTVRQLLIQRGQEIRNEKGDLGYFARGVATKIQNLMYSNNPAEGVVITDWRLPVEYETLCQCLQYPIVKVRVQRWGQGTSPVGDSETEHQLDTWTFDCIVHNLGHTLRDLEIEVSQKLIQQNLHIQSSQQV
jgi:hypothetical protein